ncbi:MAG: NUDIX domain-containing protein [Phycisphaerales bacterium]|nr:NUDIX domain-containing protein [Phycisphaerales bacterium]
MYVLRTVGTSFEVLQLRRVEVPLAGTWQPVMGHIEPGETAITAAAREAGQELGLNLADEQRCTDLFALEQVHPFFIAEWDAVILSPRIVAVVGEQWEPALDGEHDAHRWLPIDSAPASFMWPGQRAALAEIVGLLGPMQDGARRALRIDRLKLLV